MPPINIKVDGVRTTNSLLKQTHQSLLNEKSGLLSLRSIIDSEILARRNIGIRITQAYLSIDDLEKKLKKLEKLIDDSMDQYTNVENQLNRSASLIKSSPNLSNGSVVYAQPTSAIQGSEKWESKKAKVKENYFGMTDFDWLAPIAGTNILGTLLDAGVAFKMGLKVLKGYEVVRSKNGNVKIKSDQPTVRKKAPNGRPRAKYKIYDDSYIRSQAKRGNYIEAASYSKNVKMATGAALKDKLGWVSIGIDVFSDTKDNKSENASNSKIAGDILGDVAVGLGTIAVGGATVALLPAAAGALTIAAVGLGVSVGMSYVTEGIKWNVDLDEDGEDDSLKDMAKTGFKKGIDTVAGWFK